VRRVFAQSKIEPGAKATRTAGCADCVAEVSGPAWAWCGSHDRV